MAEFYEMFGRWLAGNPVETKPERDGVAKPQLPWGSTDEDLSLARFLWGKLTDRAKGMFNILIDQAGMPVHSDTISEQVGIPNGSSGVAGVLAWPGRYCLQIGRKLPVESDEDPDGGSSVYWMQADVAALFKRVRDGT